MTHIKDNIARLMRMRVEIIQQLGIDADRMSLEDESLVAQYVKAAVMSDLVYATDENAPD